MGGGVVLEVGAGEDAAAELGEAGDRLAGAELEHGVGGGAVAVGVMDQLLRDRRADEPAALVLGDRAADGLGGAAGEGGEGGVVHARVVDDEAQGLGAADPPAGHEVEDDRRQVWVGEGGHHRGGRELAGGAAGVLGEGRTATHPQLIEGQPHLGAGERGEAAGDHLTRRERRIGGEQPGEPRPELGVVEAGVLHDVGVISTTDPRGALRGRACASRPPWPPGPRVL